MKKFLMAAAVASLAFGGLTATNPFWAYTRRRKAGSVVSLAALEPPCAEVGG